MKTDHLFYRLFHTLPRLFFDLLEQPGWPAELYRFQSVEVKQTALRLDGLFTPPAERPELPLFFIEVQFQREEDLYARLFAEIFLYLKQYQPPHPWQAVVIYPSRAIEVEGSEHYQVLLDSPKVRRIYLDEWTQPPETLSQRLMHLLLATPEEVSTAAQTLLSPALDLTLKPVILDLIETILVYKLPALSREEIQTMLGLTHQDLKKSRFYQEVSQEGRLEGKLEGRREGKAGRETGRPFRR